MRRRTNAQIMTPAEVAELFGVSSKTVWRWSRDGLLPYFLTLGNRRRYRRVDVQKIRDQM